MTFPPPHQCQYIHGDVLDGGHFCCAPVHAKDYCEDHYKKCYTKIQQRDPSMKKSYTGFVLISSSVSVQQFEIQRGL